MKNNKSILLPIALVALLISSPTFSMMRLAKQAVKTALITTGGLATTTVAGLATADIVATEFNKIDPDMPNITTPPSLCYEPHDNKTRKKIASLAARLGIKPEEFAEIHTCYDTSLEDPKDFALYESIIKSARKTLEAKFGEYSREALDEEYLVRKKLLLAFSRINYQNIFAASSNFTNGKPQRHNTVETPINISPPKKNNMSILHELVHIRRINPAKRETLPKKIKWAYNLHEEFRADYEALQVANKEEIQEWIHEFERHLDCILNGEKKEIKVLVQTPHYQTSLVRTKSFTPEHPTWTEKLPQFIKPYAQDSCFNLNSKKPHPPVFIRLAMARCALLCKKWNSKTKR